MTLTLTVDERAWRAHIARVVDEAHGVVPVVKGNGYGFGRALLAREASELADEVAVGTVFEVDGIDAPRVSVLTPVMAEPPPLPPGAVLTVGSTRHVDVLRAAGWCGDVAVKLESSMHRFGAPPEEVRAVVAAAVEAGLAITGFLLHLPLTTAQYDDCAAVAEIDSWLRHLDPAMPLSVSHVSPAHLAELRRRHPGRELRLRTGTALWHGDKSFLHLSADVIDARPVRAGTGAGYHGSRVEADATLVMIGAGTAHGVTPLPDGRSPFHHRRRRLALLEPPHMHTSIVTVPAGDPVPEPGEQVDVQRPLTAVFPDRIVWV